MQRLRADEMIRAAVDAVKCSDNYVERRFRARRPDRLGGRLIERRWWKLSWQQHCFEPMVRVAVTGAWGRKTRVIVKCDICPACGEVEVLKPIRSMHGM